jgi:predicted methyltransferase
MSKESKRVHIAILEPKEISFNRPEARCLQLSVPMELKKALEVAGRYTELLTQLKEFVFIEEEGVKATKEFQCEPCNNRSSERRDFEYIVSELSPKTR